ncbi:hypothetical protein JIX56_30955 [Streptomyces sp. CA-210063]|uniref:hypothetical protein n=1 Tax=Streptomyces sp. CA-210063 TaxID=2801029 RepID=UPI00214C5F62|nr:hypothetical protein [Streptomyces sp. CA-210063]UUU33909.1 hypothetical protein JIX56_30955 [Streptomyces sp. CA-210063]
MEHENEQLIAEYAAAFEEWAASEDAELWDRTSGDGLDEEPPADEWAATDER